jgi:hypothetical protein
MSTDNALRLSALEPRVIDPTKVTRYALRKIFFVNSSGFADAVRERQTGRPARSVR